MKKRGLNKKFLNAMRQKLEDGRKKGYAGWDCKWENCNHTGSLDGATGTLMANLAVELLELSEAITDYYQHLYDLHRREHVLSEAADVANYAMMIADIHGALE